MSLMVPLLCRVLLTPIQLWLHRSAYQYVSNKTSRASPAHVHSHLHSHSHTHTHIHSHSHIHDAELQCSPTGRTLSATNFCKLEVRSSSCFKSWLTFPLHAGQRKEDRVQSWEQQCLSNYLYYPVPHEDQQPCWCHWRGGEMSARRHMLTVMSVQSCWWCCTTMLLFSIADKTCCLPLSSKAIVFDSSLFENVMMV